MTHEPICHKCGEPASRHGDFGFRDHAPRDANGDEIDIAPRLEDERAEEDSLVFPEPKTYPDPAIESNRLYKMFWDGLIEGEDELTEENVKFWISDYKHAASKLANADAHQQAMQAAQEDKVELKKENEWLRAETRCPDCGCCTPQDAESKECGCDSAVCSRTKPLAEQFIEQYQRAQALEERVEELTETICDVRLQLAESIQGNNEAKRAYNHEAQRADRLQADLNTLQDLYKELEAQLGGLI